jgi:hydroxypyruvate reductase
VVGDPLDVIASGPTIPDPTTYADALSILDKYALRSEIPDGILNHLTRGILGDIPDTPKPGDPISHRVQNVIIGSNLLAARAAINQAEKEGFQSMLLTSYLQGEACQVGKVIGAIARQIALTGDPIPRPACLIAGGETTVTVRGDGLGGRNQELALGAVTEIAGLRNIALVTLATDGGDGPTDAAGAIISGDTLSQAQRVGLDPIDYLNRNDAYHFFEHLGDLIKPGPTHTNVNDLTFLFAFQNGDE